MALSAQDFNRILQESSGYSGFGMRRYDELSALGASNRQMVEIALNTPIVGDVAKQNLIANFDVSQGFGQLANEQLTQLGATKDQIINIASTAPVIGTRMKEQYPELKKIDYDRRHANLKSQLQGMYDTLVEAEPSAAYGGRQSDIDKIFFNQAKKLADKGVGDLAELTERVDDNGNRYVINRNTGDDLFKINRDRDTGVNKWGDVFSGVKDGANFGIEFDPEGRAVLFPVHEKTKGLAQQLVGRDLAKLVTPIATVAGAIYGGPAGAAAGSAAGQLATTGEIDPLKVALAAGATYAGQSLFGGATPSADLANTTTGGMLGADAGFAVAEGAGSAAAGAGAGTGLLGADAAFIADYANTLAGQGLGEAAIAQNLAAAGVDTANATLAANLAASGSGISEIANTLSSFAPTGATSLFTGTGADLANFGITAGGAGVGLTAQQLQAIQAGQIAGNTFAEQVANVQQLIPGGTGLTVGGATTGATATKGLLDQLGDAAKNLLGTDASSMLGSLLSAGIDYETASRIADQARAEGKSIMDKAQELGRQGQLPQTVLDNLNTLAATTAQQFREAGEAAQVPFTPFTVRTGAGTATMGPGEAVATAAQPYAQIQQQAQQQAFNTLAAMNPAQASQTLFGQMQALTQPVQQRQQQQLLGTLGQRGLLGFGQNLPTVGGATRTVNPLLESLLSAQGTERAQQALQATQFGTTEAQRQAALSQALTAQAQGIDQQTLGLLGQAGQMGQAEQALAQANATRQLQATTAGLGLPLSTGLATAGMQQRGLEFAAGAGLQGQQAALPLQLQAGLIEAGRTQNLSDLYKSAVNEIFR